MISEGHNSSIIRAKFINPALVSVQSGDEPQPSSLRKRFSSSTRCLFFLLFIVLILSPPLSSWAEDTSMSESATVQLTTEEQAWLKAHPDIVLGYTDVYEPEVIINRNGSLRGLLVDFLDELNRRLGIRIDLRINAIPKVLEEAKERKIDGILNIHPEYANKLGLLKTKGYMAGYPVVFTRSDFSFEHPADMAGKKIAIIDKAYFSEKIVKQYGNGATILKVKGSLEGLQSVDKRDADLFIGATFNAYLITKYHLFGVVPKYFFNDYPDKFSMAIRPDWPVLVSILNKGISSFSPNEIDAIVAKWIPLLPNDDVPELTEEEKAWLAQKHKVNVRVANFPPYMILGENKISGIVIDYLNLIAEHTGVTFEFVVENRPWQEALESLKSHQGPDVITSLSPLEERKSYMNFSEPYYVSPRVIFTRNESPVISGIDDLNSKILAVPHGTFIQKKVEEEYPEIRLLLNDTDLEAIKAVAFGKADAFIGNLINTSQVLLLHGINNLKIAAPSPYADDVYTFGIRKDWPELTSIINKGLSTISSQEKLEIRSKYMAVRYEHGIRIIDVAKWILSIAGVAFLVIFFFIFWNKQLSRKVQKSTAELSKSESKYRGLVDNSMVGVFSTTLDGRFIFVNDPLAKMYDFDSPESMMAQETLSRWTDLKLREQMLDKLQKQGSITNFEAEAITHIGRHIHVLFSVKLLGDTIFGMVMDVTDRKQSEEKLLYQAMLLKNVSDAIVSTDIEHKVVNWNKAAERIFGWSAKQAFGQVFKDFTDIEYLDGSRDEMFATINQEEFWQGDIKQLRKDGERIFVQLTASAIKDDKGKIIGTVGVLRDITERKQAQINIEKSFTDIKRLKKLLEEESSYLREEINLEHNYKNIIGNTDAVKYVLFKVEQVSESDTNVLVLGETGTGKELIARAIHHNSPRHKRPLIKVNCATLPSHLIESELFGHERGSFTSAHTKHIGRFEVAHGSSIFLDEIGELPLELQAKLLRVIEDGEFERLGSTKTIKVDVRIIAATNRDLEKDVSEGRFRQDLWYRINVVPITIPPLRDRVEDIPLIVQYYLDVYNKKQGKKITSIPVKTMKALQSYGWPGNVRELINIIERAVVNTSGSKFKLAEELKQNDLTFPEEFKSLYDMERDYLIKVLKKTHWKVSGENSAAEILGLNRGTLRSKMKKMDIHKP